MTILHPGIIMPPYTGTPFGPDADVFSAASVEETWHVAEAEPLKPCPFCGETPKLSNGRPSITRTDKWMWVSCKKCDGEGPPDLGVSGAIESWNTRPLEDALNAEIARLRKVLQEWQE